MSAARELPAKDYLRLRLAGVDLIEACGGTRRAAAHTRVGHQYLSKCTSRLEDHEELFLAADVVADLEAECGAPIFTRALAELSGFTLVRSPDALAAESDEVGLLKVAKESTEAIAAAWAAKADGRVTGGERAEVSRQIDEAIAALVELRLRWAMESENA